MFSIVPNQAICQIWQTDEGLFGGLFEGPAMPVIKSSLCNSSYYSKSSYIGKTVSATRNLINSSPKQKQTTFAVSSVFILILCIKTIGGHAALIFLVSQSLFPHSQKVLCATAQSFDALLALFALLLIIPACSVRAFF